MFNSKYCQVPCPSEKELQDLEKRVQWLTAENKRIVIHFTPYHGSWLNQVCSFVLGKN